MIRASNDFFSAQHLAYISMYAGSFPESEQATKTLRTINSQSVVGADGVARNRITYKLESMRLIAEGPCIQRMHHKIRNAILPSGAIDLDFKNCMPSIIKGVCISKNISCPHLTFFCNNVKDCMKDLNHNKITKSMLFTGNGGLDINNGPDWMRRLVNEINNTIAPELVGHEPELWKEAQEVNAEKKREKEQARLKKDRVYMENAHGIFLSRVYFKHETKATASLYKQGVNLGLWKDDVVFMFDGLCVLPSKEVDCNTLRQLELAVEQETGLKLDLAIKPMEPKLDINLGKIPDSLSVVNMHEEASDIFLASLGPDILICDNVVWVKHRGLWMDDECNIDRALIPRCTAMNIKLLSQNKDGSITHVPFSSDLKHARHIVNLAKMKARQDPGFSKRIVLDSQFKVAFRNGYLEFHPDQEARVEFHQGAAFDTKVRIEYDFPPRIEEDIQFVYDKILRPPFDNSEEGALDRFLLALARSLAGHLDKMSYIITGFRDSAKSALMQFTGNTLGSYLSHVPAEILRIGYGAGSDVFRKNAWMFDAEDARVIVMSETTAEKDQATVYSGDELKRIQSMKEGNMARKLHQHQRVVYSIGTVFLSVNDVPIFQPADALEKVNIFNLPNKFKSETEVERAKFSRIMKVADERVEGWIREPRYTAAFLHIILEHYDNVKVEPTENMIERVEQLQQESGEDLYDRLFEITLDPSDVIEQSKVLKILRANKANVGHDKFTREMEEIIRQRTRKDKLTAFKFATRDKVGTVPRRKLYCGIKIRKQEPEDIYG